MVKVLATNDLLFKKVLASEENKDILAGFIQDFFEIIPDEIIINNPYSIHDYKEIIENEEVTILRETMRDISISLKLMNITLELQVRQTQFFEERSLYYPFDRYCQNYNNFSTNFIAENENEKGTSKGKFNRYSTLKPVYTLNILGYKHFNDELPLRVFQLYDPKRKKCFENDLIKIGFFELAKENPETVHQRYWREFFLTGIVPENAPDYIKKATTIINYVNLSKEEQRVTDALEKARATYDAEFLYAEEKALERGLKRGLEQGLERGLEQGEENLAELIRQLTKENRMDEIVLCIDDKEYRRTRMKEFGIIITP